MMNEQSLEILTSTIAKEHGVMLNADDPVLMLHTINAHMLEENRKAQHVLLESFKQDMELIMSRWYSESKETAERILNASLQAAQKNMREEISRCTLEFNENLQVEIQTKLTDAIKKSHQTENTAKWNLAASVLTFLSACMIVMALIIHH